MAIKYDKKKEKERIQHYIAKKIREGYELVDKAFKDKLSTMAGWQLAKIKPANILRKMTFRNETGEVEKGLTHKQKAEKQNRREGGIRSFLTRKLNDEKREHDKRLKELEKSANNSPQGKRIAQAMSEDEEQETVNNYPTDKQNDIVEKQDDIDNQQEEEEVTSDFIDWGEIDDVQEQETVNNYPTDKQNDIVEKQDNIDNQQEEEEVTSDFIDWGEIDDVQEQEQNEQESDEDNSLTFDYDNNKIYDKDGDEIGVINPDNPDEYWLYDDLVEADNGDLVDPNTGEIIVESGMEAPHLPYDEPDEDWGKNKPSNDVEYNPDDYPDGYIPDEADLLLDNLKDLASKYPGKGAEILQDIIDSMIRKYGEDGFARMLESSPFDLISMAQNIVHYNGQPHEDIMKLVNAIRATADLDRNLLNSIGDSMDEDDISYEEE